MAHLSVSLHLGVDKGPQDVGGDGQVGEDQLGLLMEAEQGEVVPQLHGLDGVLLLCNTNIGNVLHAAMACSLSLTISQITVHYHNDPEWDMLYKNGV